MIDLENLKQSIHPNKLKKMDKVIQISSGKGPLECQFVVAKVLKVFLEELKENTIEYEIIHREKGNENLTLKSVTLILTGKNLEIFLENWLGSICWIGKSTFRTNHQRSNWFIGVFELENLEKTEFDPKDIQFQTTRSQGSGGQNVNKVSTAVRATHLPTKISVFVQDTRSQVENRKISLKRLEEKVLELDLQKMEKRMQETWKNQTQIERGNPVITLTGTDFKKENSDQTFKTKRSRLKNELKKEQNELN